MICSRLLIGSSVLKIILFIETAVHKKNFSNLIFFPFETDVSFGVRHGTSQMIFRDKNTDWNEHRLMENNSSIPKDKLFELCYGNSNFYKYNKWAAVHK